MEAKEYIADANSKLKAFAEGLAEKAQREIKNIRIEQENKPSLEQLAREKDDPGRPWKILGGIAIIASCIKLFGAQDATWPYLVGAAGIASASYGYICGRNKNANAKLSSQISAIDYNKTIYDLITEARSITDAIKKEWDKYTDTLKQEVQKTIEEADLTGDVKQKCLDHTYYVERITMTMTAFTDKLNGIAKDASFIDNINSSKNEFSATLRNEIIDKAKKQIETYEEILKYIA